MCYFLNVVITCTLACLADLSDLPRAMRYAPLIFVVALTLVMGLWQLQRQGWRVARENYPWTLAGVWGVVSALKDSVKLEPPYRYVLTWPMWLAGRLREGGSNLAVVVLVLLYMGIVAGVLVLVMRHSVPAPTMRL
jgi:hypothetical protein